MNRFLQWILLILVLTGCQREASPCEEWVWVKHIDSEEITRTVIRFSARMDLQWRLKLEDSRVFYTDKIEKIRLVYSTMAILDVEQSRTMIVDVVEGILNALNHNMIIRADMYREPFKAEDLEIYISLESYFGQYIDPFMVGWIEVNEGMVTYYMNSLKDYQLDEWHYRAEPYGKAKEIVLAEREAAVLYPEVERSIEKSLNAMIEGEFIDIPQRRNTPSRSLPRARSLPRTPPSSSSLPPLKPPAASGVKNGP